jgi:hypothetical protein
MGFLSRGRLSGKFTTGFLVLEGCCSKEIFLLI